MFEIQPQTMIQPPTFLQIAVDTHCCTSLLTFIPIGTICIENFRFGFIIVNACLWFIYVCLFSLFTFGGGISCQIFCSILLHDVHILFTCST